jgi:hypothetical protein
MENNKLIAEFMGIDYVNVDAYQLPYNKDWNWLIPVIDKCYQEHMSKHIAEAVMTCNINEAYNAVVEFIKEYNDERQ